MVNQECEGDEPIGIAVVDESGGNRPGEQNGFSAAAIVLRHDLVEELSECSREIGRLVGKRDYKYKHVANSSPARRVFLNLFKRTKPPLFVFGFYVAEGGLRAERMRTAAAGIHYGEHLGSKTSTYPGHDLDPESRHYSMSQFIHYMAPAFMHFSRGSGIRIQPYWDDRNDLAFVARSWQEAQELYRLSMAPGLDVHKTDLLESARGELSPITRIAGVLAGDIGCYFSHHGDRIWACLDESGMLQNTDPVQLARLGIDAAKDVSIRRDRFADPKPAESGVHCMLQGYTKHLLSNLLTFRSHAPHSNVQRYRKGNQK